MSVHPIETHEQFDYTVTVERMEGDYAHISCSAEAPTPTQRVSISVLSTANGPSRAMFKDNEPTRYGAEVHVGDTFNCHYEHTARGGSSETSWKFTSADKARRRRPIGSAAMIDAKGNFVAAGYLYPYV